MQTPQPRSGILREWDTLIGPGASLQEQRLILGVALAATLGILGYALVRELPWTIWQWGAALLLALDLFGGVVANATPAARRWYHRPGQTNRDHLRFVAIHLIQIIICALAFWNGNWGSVVIAYAYLISATLIILNTPPALQRPVSYTAYIGALGIALYAVPMPAGMEWFLPILYFKLLVSHLGMAN